MPSKFDSLIFVFFALWGSLAAGVQNPAELSSEQIRSEFKKFDKPTKLAGKFDQTKTIKELQISLITTGFFQITQIDAEKAQVLWDIETPEKIKICIDPQQIFYHNLKLNKKSVFKKSDMSQMENPGLGKLIELIKLDPELIAKNFHIRKKSRSFLIRPKQRDDSFFTEAELTLDSKKNITRLLLTENNGDTLEIRFKNLNEKIAKPADLSKAVCQ